MPPHAPSARPPGLAPVHGFTLVEMLVVLVILGALASMVSLSLPDTDALAKTQSVAAWQAQIERGMLHVDMRSARVEWAITPASENTAGPISARLWQYQGGQRLPLDPVSVPLDARLSLVRMETNSQQVAPGTPLDLTDTPLFALTITDGQQHWQLHGRADGRVDLIRP